MKSDMETDVVMLGGGPAGGTAAACLAGIGHRVIALERALFPRFHIGESLLPCNTRLFEELGLTEKIRRQNFVAKQGAQRWLGNGKKRVQIVFREGLYNEETTALQVERAQFDQLLLEHARESGATAKEGCTVASFAVEPDHGAVNYRDAEGNPAELRAKFLLIATGQASFTGVRQGVTEACKNHREMDLFRKQIQNCYSEPFIDLFMADHPPLQLRSEGNSILAGRLRQNWSIRWRFWVFHLCVRFQKRFSIVPRTAWH